MITKTFKVEIGSIYVSTLDGWYNFDFKLFIDGKLKEWGNLDGTYSGQSASAFRKALKRGWAHTLVLQKYY